MVQFLSYLPLVPRTNYCQLFELRILYLPKKGTKQICRGGSVAERLEAPEAPSSGTMHPERNAGFILCSLEFEYSATLVSPSWDS